MKTSFLNKLGATTELLKLCRAALFLTASVLLLTQLSQAQDSKTAKVPDGEAQFTQEQLEEYYLVYKNPDVRYLRTLFDSYRKNSGGTEQERQQLKKYREDYFQSKFTVMSRENNTFGGTLVTLLFQDRPDKVFVAWVYPEGSDKRLTLKKFSVSDFSEEDIKRIRVRYKKLIEDKTHAM